MVGKANVFSPYRCSYFSRFLSNKENSHLIWKFYVFFLSLWFFSRNLLWAYSLLSHLHSLISSLSSHIKGNSNRLPLPPFTLISACPCIMHKSPRVSGRIHWRYSWLKNQQFSSVRVHTLHIFPKTKFPSEPETVHHIHVFLFSWPLNPISFHLSIFRYVHQCLVLLTRPHRFRILYPWCEKDLHTIGLPYPKQNPGCRFYKCWLKDINNLNPCPIVGRSYPKLRGVAVGSSIVARRSPKKRSVSRFCGSLIRSQSVVGPCKTRCWRVVRCDEEIWGFLCAWNQLFVLAGGKSRVFPHHFGFYRGTDKSSFTQSLRMRKVPWSPTPPILTWVWWVIREIRIHRVILR